MTVTFSVLNAISTYPAVETLLVPTILALLPMSSLFVQGNQNNNSAQQPERDEQLHITSHPATATTVRVACQNGGPDGAKTERGSTNQHRKGTAMSTGTLLDRELYEIDSMK